MFALRGCLGRADCHARIGLPVWLCAARLILRGLAGAGGLIGAAITSSRRLACWAIPLTLRAASLTLRAAGLLRPLERDLATELVTGDERSAAPLTEIQFAGGDAHATLVLATRFGVQHHDLAARCVGCRFCARGAFLLAHKVLLDTGLGD